MIVSPIGKLKVTTTRGEFTFLPTKDYECKEVKRNKCNCSNWYWVWFDREKGKKVIFTSRKLLLTNFKLIATDI